ncbi:uncharacterized protein BP5553_01515 [Venustampulla echinocandica]|uniref:Uncharacterized protein n=1 Tax=Venustampulla echinocandica TaxID=2656787 RepID=A0A370U180_9HELO|nr:uncharacterized protein BP5553_01515 [Venustampulla echinocandica]RDL41536.1 hypothetical protein BP5553_01515 [Venustampulla echinocandica]
MSSKPEFNFSVPPPLSVMKGLHIANEEKKIEKLKEMARKALEDLQVEREKGKEMAEELAEVNAVLEEQSNLEEKVLQMQKASDDQPGSLKRYRDLEKVYKELDGQYRGMKKHREDLLESVDELRKEKDEVQEKNYDLELRNIELETSLKDAVERIQRMQQDSYKGYAELKEQIAKEKQTTKGLEEDCETLQATLDKTTEERELNASKSSEAEERCRLLSATNKRLEEQLDARMRDCVGIDTQYQDLRGELATSNNKLKRVELEKATLLKEVNDLKSRSSSPTKSFLSTRSKMSDAPDQSQNELAHKKTKNQLKIVQKQLDLEKEKVATFQNQTMMMRNEMKKFPLNPFAFRVADKSNAQTKLLSLEDELTNTTSEAANDVPDKTNDGSAGVEQKPIPKGKESEHSAEWIEEHRKLTRTKSIVKVIKTYTHHPIRCWLQTELDLAVLIICWAIATWNFIVPYIRNAGLAPVGGPVSFSKIRLAVDTVNNPFSQPRPRSDSIDSFFTQSSDSGSVAEETIVPNANSNGNTSDDRAPGTIKMMATIKEDNLPSSPSNRLKLLKKRASRLFISPPTGDYPLTAWQQLTCIDPRRKPSVIWTLFYFAFHVAFYLLIYFTYQERQMWLAANNVTRAFVDNLYKHRQQYNRGVVFEFLSQGVATGIERSMLSFAENAFGYEVTAFPRPG